VKKIASLFAVVATFWVASPVAKADSVTSSGTLGVTATVEPCISLTFVSHSGALALSSGSGTAAATLGFGNISAYGYTPPTGITQALVGSGASATAFTVTTSFDVLVMEANSTSANYSLTAALNSADTANTWTLNSVALTTSAQQVVATGTYDTTTNLPFVLQVPFTETGSGLSISNTVNFVATAN
jgi:hypothetical protein